MASKTKLKGGRFSETSIGYAKILFKIKGTIAGKDVTIAISPTEDKNYITPKITNQLVVPESNIIGKFVCLKKTIQNN